MRKGIYRTQSKEDKSGQVKYVDSEKIKNNEDEARISEVSRRSKLVLRLVLPISFLFGFSTFCKTKKGGPKKKKKARCYEAFNSYL